jgi:hypothetical protein
MKRILNFIRNTIMYTIQVCCKKCKNNYEWDNNFPKDTNKCPTCGTQN